MSTAELALAWICLGALALLLGFFVLLDEVDKQDKLDNYTSTREHYIKKDE